MARKEAGGDTAGLEGNGKSCKLSDRYSQTFMMTSA